tara:strand:- start:2115 stop:2336 length:222 start_codon:yes stop_codon:yes gene_type:complete
MDIRLKSITSQAPVFQYDGSQSGVVGTQIGTARHEQGFGRDWRFHADKGMWFNAQQLREIADALDRLKEEQDE